MVTMTVGTNPEEELKNKKVPAHEEEEDEEEDEPSVLSGAGKFHGS
jgi:hypothetical protein